MLTDEDVFGFFRGERLAWKDDVTGLPVFEMKRKEPDDETIYYIIRVYEDNFSTDEKRIAFHEQVFPIIKESARKLEIHLFDFNEISERVMEASAIRTREEEVTGKLLRFAFVASVELMDIATGELVDLDVSVYTK